RTGCEKCCCCYLEGRIFFCGAWGQALFVVSGHASHQHDGCEGPGRNIHLGAAMHAALRCLGMRVRLRVTERVTPVVPHARPRRRLRGLLRPTTREKLFSVTTRRCARYPPPAAAYFQWFRGTAKREHVEQDGFTGIY
ncbi:surface protease GP63, partial [Trypanosoma cruzi]